MPLLPGLILCQFAYTTGQKDCLVGWMYTVNLAPPLRTRLDGSALKFAFNQHLQPKFCQRSIGHKYWPGSTETG